MKFCTECGHQLKDEAIFCPNCGAEMKSSSTNKENKQPLTINFTKKHKIIAVSIIAILILLVGGMKFYSYYTSPETAAKNYVKALNENDFEEVYSYFIDIPENITKEMVIKSLKDTTEKVPLHIEVMEKGIERTKYLKELEMNDENQAYIPVVYKDKDTEEFVLTLEQDEDGKWKIPFFLPLYDVTVYAPKGTKIFWDKEEIGTISIGNEITIDSVLEGKYLVEMSFVNDIVPPYQEELYVDNYYYLESPYETYPIEIVTIPGVEIIFDGVTVEDKDGYVTIDEVIEAEHEIKLTLEGMIEPITTKINVYSENTYFEFIGFQVDDDLQAELYTLLKDFNDASIEAGKEKNPEYYMPYVTEIKYHEFIDLYERIFWYKSVFIEYTMEPVHVEVASKDLVYFTVIENWYGKREVIEDGRKFNQNKDTEIEYKQKITWQYELIKEDGNWKINNEELLDIEKVYLDKNGNWTEY